MIGEVDPTIINLTVFVLAVFVGYHVVWNVTPALHTPLMSQCWLPARRKPTGACGWELWR